MHTMAFEVKHAHLALLRFGRPEAEQVGLTPARVDMLRVILDMGGGSLMQHELWKHLCVSRPVVSIMVRALEKLKFVTRSPWKGSFCVKLTAKARVALRRLYYNTINQGFLKLAIMCALSKDNFPRKGWSITVERIIERLQMLRAAFGRGLHHYNPWPTSESDWDFYYAPVRGNPNRESILPKWEKQLRAGDEDTVQLEVEILNLADL